MKSEQTKGERGKEAKEAKKWIRYVTETGLKCAYCWDAERQDYRVKVLSKMPKSYYYSAANEAGSYFDEYILPTLKSIYEEV